MAYCIWKQYKLKISALEVFRCLKKRANAFFLDSSLNRDHSLGRYSYLGAEPYYIFKSSNADPFTKLRALVDKHKMPAASGGINFTCGAVGFLSYDLGFALEKKVLKRQKPGADVPDCFFGFYNTAVVIDHLKNTLTIFAAGAPEKNYFASRALAKENFGKLQREIADIGSGNARAGTAPYGDSPCCAVPRNDNPLSCKGGLAADFTKAEYLAAIKKAKAYIKAGDIYQVNLAQQFSCQTQLSAFEIYCRLRRLSPAYFNAYFDAGDFQLLSSSPERFLKLENSRVFTRPMKGTRPRSRSLRKDRSFKKGLLASAKDKAELMMIVDLERNDLGRVCAYDSVKVNRLRQVEEYNTVFQTTASISGKLYPGKDRLDLLRAAFPGGSITGCPKIRAMQIIEELEPGRRGIYTGALGYLSFSGDMDFNILIRSILKKGKQLYFGAGGGIVADSRPLEEYNETLVKARAMIQAVSGEV